MLGAQSALSGSNSQGWIVVFAQANVDRINDYLEIGGTNQVNQSWITNRKARLGVVGILALAAMVVRPADASEYRIPMAGNTFRTRKADGDSNRFRRRAPGVSLLPGETQTTYFRTSQACTVQLFVRLRSREEVAINVVCESLGFTQRLRVLPEATQPSSNQPTSSQPASIGTIKIGRSQYVALSFQLENSASLPVELVELVVKTDDAESKLDFVRNNEGNMFYWGRRGPSVHLNYRTPRDTDLQFAYTEVTVPVGEDPIGSFYMANGFGEGYFGFQVNSSSQRRVLFSVWSPFSTNNPREIPADQRIQLLAKGADVNVGQFGNEGSGGQSYLIYPWKAGTTYRFLTKVIPDGEGNTVYTSWFGDKDQEEWKLIASFSRPKTNTHLRRFHSFLESFNPETGYLGRRALYGNVWCRSVAGDWFACTEARFTADATGRGRHRLDFEGGVSDEAFYLRNCGFFDRFTVPDTNLQLDSSDATPPKIAFEDLPMR